MSLVIRCTLILFLLSINLAAAAKVKISGSVKDENGKPLPFVNVYRLNSFDGAMTDEKGEFVFETARSKTINIVASIVGYKKYSADLSPGESTLLKLSIKMESETVKLSEAVVTGSAFSSEEGKGVVVSQMDVYMTPGGAADILQAIKTLPGLTNVSESAQLYVRGGDPIETLTIIDNASVYHPYTFESAYGGLFSNLNTGAMKSLFFSSGGFSAKYGNALSGVLEIKTKDEPLANTHNINVSMANMSFESNLPVIEEKSGLRLYGNYSLNRPLMVLNGSLDKFTNVPQSKDISGIYSHKYSETGRIKLFGMYAEDKQGVKIDRAEFDGNFNGRSFNKFANLHISDILWKELFVYSSFAVNEYTKYWELGILDLKNTDMLYKYRFDTEYNFASGYRLLTGFDIEDRSDFYQGEIPDENYNMRPDAPKIIIDECVRNKRFGGYVEIEAGKIFADSLYAVTGLRYDRYIELKKEWLDPRFSIGYKLGGNSGIRFSYGLFHQLPDLRLFAETDGNPGLMEMEAEHFILSYDKMFRNKTNFRIETYYKKYSNLPLEDDIVNYTNEGHGYAYGADVIIKGKINNDLDGWVSYGYLNSKREWMDNTRYASSDYDITHNFSLVGNCNLAKSWKIGLNYKYSTGRPYTPVTGSRFIEQQGIYEPLDGETNSKRYPDYHRLDVRFTYFHSLFGRYFTIVYFEMMNILNINNIFGYSYNYDYSERHKIESYFGRRTIVVGASITL